VTVGADGPLPEALHEEYRLDRFLDLVPAEKMVFLSRFIVAADHRGGAVTAELIQGLRSIWFEHLPEVSFMDCEPHLLAFYSALGFRAYGSPYLDENLDVLFPMVLFNDPAYLEELGTPLLDWGLRELPQPTNLERLRERLPATPPARPLALDGAEWTAEFERLSADRPGGGSLFAGLAKPDVDRLLSRSQIIELEPEATLIRRGQASRNVYVVLAGELTIHDGERLIRTCGQGEVVGDVAFLLRGTRTVDVHAGAAGARVVSISERLLGELIDSHSRTAALLLLNLARVGARRLAASGAYDR
jgi:hypothetical protein